MVEKDGETTLHLRPDNPGSRGGEKNRCCLLPVPLFGLQCLIDVQRVRGPGKERWSGNFHGRKLRLLESV